MTAAAGNRVGAPVAPTPTLERRDRESEREWITDGMRGHDDNDDPTTLGRC